MRTKNDRTIAFLNIVKILSNFTGYRDWLVHHHKINDHEPLLCGHKYLLTISIQWLIESLFYHDPFGLHEDRTITRAYFTATRLDDIPNSCEKTVFCKNIWSLTRNMRRAQSWDKITEDVELVKFTKLLLPIINDYSNTKLRSKDWALRIATMFNAYIFLIDTSHGHPKAAHGSFFKTETSPTYLENVFSGYCYGLQFLWHQLLPKQEFAKSLLKDLHRAEIIFGKHAHEYTNDELDFNDEDSEEIKFERKVYDKWQCIDQFFKHVQRDIIWPIEKEVRKTIADSYDSMLNLKPIDRSVIDEILNLPTKEPEYFVKNDPKSITKRLDAEFYWYPYLADSASEFVFSRTITIQALLIGLAHLHVEDGFDDRVLVKVIKHPIGKDKHDITIAILMGYQGRFVDDSRWWILRHCATDYSGGGMKSYSMIQDTISKLETRVEVKTITIERNDFMTYLGDDDISHFNSTNVRKLNTQLNDSLGHARGKLFEFVVFKWLLDQNFNETSCDVKINSEQIDCYARNDNIIQLFECKINLYNDDKVIQQLQNKYSATRKKYPNCEVKMNLAVFSNLSQSRKEKLEKSGIRVHHNFKNEIKTHKAFDESHRDLLPALGHGDDNRSNYAYF